MEIQILRDDDQVAERAADLILTEAESAISARGRFTLALSGGRTPLKTLRALGGRKIAWEHTFVFQVDERVAPDGDPARNLTQLQQILLDHVPLRREHIHAMPVDVSDLEKASAKYASLLQQVTGTPATLDLVHLGLGADGHTASLVPGDTVLDVMDRDVAPTGLYEGRRRLTLTYPILNRARRVLWVVTGRDKMESLRRLKAGDASIPAGRICADHAIVVADDAAGLCTRS